MIDLRTGLQNQYLISLDKGALVLQRVKKTPRSFSGIIVLGLAFCVLGFFTLIQVSVLGLVLCFIPWISRKWQYPSKVIVERTHIRLLTGMHIPNILEVPLKMIEKIDVEVVKKKEDLGPRGRKGAGFVYNFYLETIDRSYRLACFKFKDREDERIYALQKFLNDFVENQRAKG